MRAATFGDLRRRPTIVGGHMFSMFPGPAAQLRRDHQQVALLVAVPRDVSRHWDFAARNLRSARWLHRRVDVDFNGWFMCLIPTEVVARDRSEPAAVHQVGRLRVRRAGQGAGIPTVSLPGAAVWHVPWTDKNDALDWQAYFHQRNRTIAALLHSPYPRGGRLVRESFNHQLKHLLAMQYSTAELRLLALEDVLAGPESCTPTC